MPFTSGIRREVGLRRAVKRARIDPTAVSQTVDLQCVAKCEMDSHADTICAGANCRPIEYTGQQCDVSGFHEELAGLTNVPVATVATGYQSPGGEVFILIMHEVLYFGDTMNHSLINPNQIRHFGIPVSDNSFDTDKPFGIDHDDMFVQFKTEGVAVYFDSFFSTQEDLDTKHHIVITSEHE